MKTLAHSFLACFGLLLCGAISGCSNSSNPVNIVAVHVEVTEIPFSFHKPRLGATFTMQSVQLPSGGIDTTYIFTVTDTAITLGGKTGALKFEGYYRPFFISYRPGGDIDIAGDFDYLFGRESWTWFPLAAQTGMGAECYSHDSLISNPDPKDTRNVERDTLIVMGRETLKIKGQPIECIKVQRRLFLELTNIKFGFKTGSTLAVDYWYAPSLGYWAKEHLTYGGADITFTLIDFTL